MKGEVVLQFPYMGTKHALAPVVAEAARRSPEGPFLDAFAGMCSVANAVRKDRPVWTNDLQCFAVTVAKSMLCDVDITQVAFEDFEDHYSTHFAHLCDRFRVALLQERLATSATNYDQFTSRLDLVEKEICRLPQRQYDLFTAVYANTYIGLEQAIEIDSLVFALNQLHPDKKISGAIRRRFLFALGRTLLRIATTTGHFAQFQTPSEKNWRRFQRSRRSSVIDCFKTDLANATGPTEPFSHINKAYNMEAMSLLRTLRRNPLKPSVVYADPPYKQDQYSRYYHLLETLILYDYPRVTGKAKYRIGRANSVFSSKSNSRRGIEALCSLTAALKSNFILSYPEDGIADIRKDEMRTLLSSSFSKVEIVHEGVLNHSTMGGSKGEAKQPVIERIYLARN